MPAREPVSTDSVVGHVVGELVDRVVAAAAEAAAAVARHSELATAHQSQHKVTDDTQHQPTQSCDVEFALEALEVDGPADSWLLSASLSGLDDFGHNVQDACLITRRPSFTDFCDKMSSPPKYDTSTVETSFEQPAGVEVAQPDWSQAESADEDVHTNKQEPQQPEPSASHASSQASSTVHAHGQDGGIQLQQSAKAEEPMSPGLNGVQMEPSAPRRTVDRVPSSSRTSRQPSAAGNTTKQLSRQMSSNASDWWSSAPSSLSSSHKVLSCSTTEPGTGTTAAHAAAVQEPASTATPHSTSHYAADVAASPMSPAVQLEFITDHQTSPSARPAGLGSGAKDSAASAEWAASLRSPTARTSSSGHLRRTNSSKKSR